ncbi:DNA alkylation repair protein [candidate division KSB1 bacterium]|nr:DNA alkylation repair protein [candidate division KSB1 bacterium]
MAERLKDIFFTETSLNKFADTIKQYYPEFDKKKFLALVFDENWESLELKAKMRHTTLCLHETLPKDFGKALDILKQTAPLTKGFEVMVHHDYVELYGLDNWDLSLPALGYFTQYGSSEFAIRPFLDKEPEKVMAWMNKWAKDKDEKVRRFASEGCRPRLPWAMALPKFKKDPGPILPVLEKLKNDPSEFVRKSVANNLNDISKDHPELVMDWCEKWKGLSENTDWIIKHACRSMLKAGNKRALQLFGHGDPSLLIIKDLKIEKTVTIGENLLYSFQLIVKGEEKTKVRLEYSINFVKSTGKLSRKIFKITENDYKPGTYSFSKRHSFVDMSTRKHFPGLHYITFYVNGEEKAKAEFKVEKF